MANIRKIHFKGSKIPNTASRYMAFCKEKNPKINIGEFWRWETTDDISKVTCQRCLASINLHNIKFDPN